jgi:hypothetical protein
MNTVINPTISHSIGSVIITPPPAEVKLNKLIGGLYAKIAVLEQRVKSLETILDRFSQIIQQK